MKVSSYEGQSCGLCRLRGHQRAWEMELAIWQSVHRAETWRCIGRILSVKLAIVFAACYLSTIAELRTMGNRPPNDTFDDPALFVFRSLRR